jgi:hypothetical protein
MAELCDKLPQREAFWRKSLLRKVGINRYDFIGDTQSIYTSVSNDIADSPVASYGSCLC